MALAYFSLGERAEEDAQCLPHRLLRLARRGDRRVTSSPAPPRTRRPCKQYVGGLRGGRLRRADPLPLLRRSRPGRPARRRRRPLSLRRRRRAMADDLPILLFAAPAELEAWLEENHGGSAGLWLKIAKKGSGVDERQLRRGARAGALLRLDRQPEARLRRDLLPAALHAAAAAGQVVADQPRRRPRR